ncbi:hypothetical protein J3R30DRAFT_618178 [Lentinula aciculospora]|uniref:Uncharacterized protein n=1 Tax=Lentinula aciculospora TaxID=153920 RepID=A0A9W9A6U6_9AGAR|nr:hypothetical protein J3R30DRAFT_618178 [Lentinula aciculospora]
MFFRGNLSIAVFLILTLLSTIFNAAVWLEAGEVSHGILSYREHNYDYGSMIPVQVPGSYGPATMTLQNDNETYALTDDRKWGAIVPPKGGFIRLGPIGTPFSITMYHQLHCVNGIRFSYVAARDGLFKHTKDREGAFLHVNHCFDVLRQSLLCKADTTLIPLDHDKQHTRRCRDWTAVRAFVDDNQRFWADIPFQLSSNKSTKGYEG